MTKTILFLLQTLVFLVVMALGSFTRPFHLQSVVTETATSGRIFVWDGIVLMLAIGAIVLLAERAARRFRSQGPWTAVAMALAAFLGLALKLGFITKEF